MATLHKKTFQKALLWLGVLLGSLLYIALPVVCFLVVADWFRAWNWVEVPCIILQSDIVVTIDRMPDYEKRDGVNFLLLYRYEHGGSTHWGNRMDFSSRVRRWDKLPEEGRYLYGKGREDTCFVNPANPEESVLRKSFPANQLFAGMLLTSLYLLVIYRVVQEKRSPRTTGR